MATPLILVTGATGKVGTALVAELRARELPVRALVRRHDARSAALAAQGAEVVVADLYDPDQLTAALTGVQHAWYLPPMAPLMIQSAATFAVAAQAARVEAIVHMSQWTSHRHHPTPMTRQTWLVDQLFATLPGIASVTFNPGMFADNFLRVIDFASLLGIYPILAHRGRSAPVSSEDMARTAAVLLADPARFAGQSIRPTGPALLSGRDMAAAVGRALGHGVLPFELPLWMFRKVARLQGVDPYEVRLLITYLEDHAQGTFEFEGGVTDTVERLTGRAPEAFETIARRYAALPFARATSANRLKALANFLITPLVPGYDTDGLDRRLRLPPAATPSLGIDEPVWRAQHGRQMADAGAGAAALRLAA
ncbi:transcriptional regulator [alpha proteobacterium AAP81b]|nr:transcriptional regulator [alpha proteobacterium AAP81b]